MNNWSVHSFGSSHTGESTNRRVLASTSGNAQHFPPQSKSHLDYSNQYLQTARSVSEPQYLVPSVTLGSNDRELLNHRLAVHKARRNSQPHRKALHERSYLSHEKYIEYKSRRRQELGKDGKPIWPPHLEAAFQNGRKKRTQHGRLLGRNELIMEWILQETGEVRDRKQISSHIQVLQKIFKNVPEWRTITAGCKEDDDEDDPEPVNCGKDYYYDSIADKVRLQKELSQQSKSETDNKPMWTDLVSERFQVQRLNFEMWVGMPEKVLKSLHNYTCISHQAARSPAIPLDTYKDWRNSFPDLETLLSAPEDDGYDMILLKSRFNLMSEFPPATSKLVLDLDLDFRDPTEDNLLAHRQLKYFTSVNRMYYNGKFLRSTEHKDCRAVEPGVVKPFFEAEWWATQLTELTRRKKDAEESKGRAACGDPDEYSRSLFRGLTIMQEIFVSQQPTGHSMLPKRRIVVLLWVFAQTHESHRGITSWQRIIPPSGHQSSISTLPTDLDSSLPPLEMDGLIKDPFGTGTTSIGLDDNCYMPMSPVNYDSANYHSGFTPYHSLGDEQREFDFSNITGFTPKPSSLPKIKPEPMNALVHVAQLPPFLPSQRIEEGEQESLFGYPSQSPYGECKNSEILYDRPADISPGVSAVRKSLVNFDMSTHDMLQAQLGNLDDTYNIQDCQHTETIMQNLGSQAPMIEHLNDLELDEGLLSQGMLMDAAPETNMLDQHQKLALDHPTLFTSPRITRPPLLAHNSFAGVLGSHNVDETLTFDTPTRNEFARVISGHLDAEHPDGDLFGNNNDAHGMAELFSTAPEFGRPRSQPVLSSTVDHEKSGSLFFGTPPQPLLSSLSSLSSSHLAPNQAFIELS